ncbi:hypothetical protein V8C86DRAFT_3036338 [Haematococcus lacustris]
MHLPKVVGLVLLLGLLLWLWLRLGLGLKRCPTTTTLLVLGCWHWLICLLCSSRHAPNTPRTDLPSSAMVVLGSSRVLPDWVEDLPTPSTRDATCWPPWSSWVQRQLVPHYTSLNQALSKLGTHRRAVLQTQALVNPVEQPRAEVLLQWQEQFKDNALQQLSKYQAWEALPVEGGSPDGQQLVQTLYLNSQGLPYSVENLAKWWKRLHTVSKATWSFVPLHELRNVFITHRLDHPEVPGPSTEASAHVMLNSPTTWHAHYDRNKKQRLALEAQANMPLYRQALLQGGVGKSRGPDQQKSRGEEGGAGSDDEA